MSLAPTPESGTFAVGGVPIDQAHAALRRVEPASRAFYVYDLDAVAQRARRFQQAFAPLSPRVAYALKANALPALLESLERQGLAADAASLGELELAATAGFPAERRLLNGNGKTSEELEWAAQQGVWAVNADDLGELDDLERAAVRHGAIVRVALRVNPRIETPGHRHVATGDEDAKFGVAPSEALDAWGHASRWPHLRVDGLHLHVGSQLLDPAPLERALEAALALRAEAGRRGAHIGLINMGGGFGVDYEHDREFPLERFAAQVTERVSGQDIELAFEPGRWLVAGAGALVSEVVRVKERDGRRFVVLAVGMNDLLRPALYGARHRIVAVRRPSGPASAAVVVGPVCESGDTFDTAAMLPPLVPGDLVALLDAGAYGASMASNYNGRPRLAELVVSGGRLKRARASETPADLGRRRDDQLG